MKLIPTVALMLASSLAQAQTGPTAAQVALLCSVRAAAIEKAGTVSAADTCYPLVLGFVQGFVSGASRGARVAFIDDAQNRATTKGIDDLQRRVSFVRPKAQCFPPAATVEQVIDVFGRYVEAHPARSNEPFASVMVDAIEGYFCPR